jgi:glycosyltransferase involved in cell wall biosynthesis
MPPGTDERARPQHRLPEPATTAAPPRPRPAARPPRVTVGMPVYNGARSLGQSIESILNQTFRDLELVISDNASTDGSFEIAQCYARQDDRVRVFRNPVNVGVTNNYSIVVGYARGEYFKWASSNDLCERSFIEKCVGVLDARADVGLCYPKTKLFVTSPELGNAYEIGVQTLDDDPCVRFRYVLEHVGLNNAINGLIRMATLRRTVLIRPYYASDITLLAELALHGKIVELPEFLFFRRFDQDSATSLQDAVRLRQYHFPRPSVGMFFQRWRRCWGYLSASCRAPLTPTQRVRAVTYVAHLWYWSLPELWSDLREAARALFRRRHPSAP